MEFSFFGAFFFILHAIATVLDPVFSTAKLYLSGGTFSVAMVATAVSFSIVNADRARLT